MKRTMTVIDEVRTEHKRVRRQRDELLVENQMLREAMASALTSLLTGPIKDDYAWVVLRDALDTAAVALEETGPRDA